MGMDSHDQAAVVAHVPLSVHMPPDKIVHRRPCAMKRAELAVDGKVLFHLRMGKEHGQAHGACLSEQHMVGCQHQVNGPPDAQIRSHMRMQRACACLTHICGQHQVNHQLAHA